jgi:hypothetical protein
MTKNSLDGKPGLPGFNGGNLIIISNNIVNFDFLNFSSFGGKGGIGKDGITIYNKIMQFIK